MPMSTLRVLVLEEQPLSRLCASQPGCAHILQTSDAISRLPRGYLFARPTSAEQLLPRLLSNRTASRLEA